MGTWANEDGLKLYYGTSDLVNTTGNTDKSVVRTLVVKVDWTDITAASAHIARITERDAFIPGGAYIRSATFNPTSDWLSGGAATLTIGLGKIDGSTAIDANGIDDLVAIAALQAVDVVDCDGALVGAALPVGSDDAYVYFTTGTATWTAGVGILTIEYIVDGL